MRAIWAITRMQLLAIRRRKLLVLPIIVALLLLLLFIPFDMGDGGELFAKEGLLRVVERIVFAAGTFFAIIVGSGAVAGDVESGTVLILAVRPVQRWQIYVGKLLGAAIALLGTYVVWGLILAGALETHFPSLPGDPSIFRFTLIDVLLSFPATLLMLAIATTLGAFLRSRAASALVLVMWGAANLFHVIARQSVTDLAGKHASDGFRTSISFAIHLARGYDWLVPKHLLIGIPAHVQGNAVDDATWQLTSHQAIALAVIVAWAVLGALLFQQRESLSTAAD